MSDLAAKAQGHDGSTPLQEQLSALRICTTRAGNHKARQQPKPRNALNSEPRTPEIETGALV